GSSARTGRRRWGSGDGGTARSWTLRPAGAPACVEARPVLAEGDRTGQITAARGTGRVSHGKSLGADITLRRREGVKGPRRRAARGTGRGALVYWGVGRESAEAHATRDRSPVARRTPREKMRRRLRSARRHDGQEDVGRPRRVVEHGVERRLA